MATEVLPAPVAPSDGTLATTEEVTEYKYPGLHGKHLDDLIRGSGSSFKFSRKNQKNGKRSAIDLLSVFIEDTAKDIVTRCNQARRRAGQRKLMGKHVETALGKIIIATSDKKKSKSGKSRRVKLEGVVEGEKTVADEKEMSEEEEEEEEPQEEEMEEESEEEEEEDDDNIDD